VSLDGNLSDFSVLETLQVIGQQRKTGTLAIHSGHRRYELRFVEGQLAGAQAPRPEDPDPLLEALVGLGWCEASEARRLRTLHSGAELAGAVRQACLLSDSLWRELEHRVLQATLDAILLWDRGRFSFSPSGAIPPSEGTWNVDQLLLETMRRLDEAVDLKAGGLTPTRVLRPTGEPMLPPKEDADPSEAANAAVERAVWQKSDGRQTLGQIISSIGLSEWDVLSCARALIDRGLLRLESGPPTMAPEGLTDLPRPQRRPALYAAALSIVFLALGLGWGVQRMGAATRAAQTAHSSERAAFDRERALREAREIFRIRIGAYPQSPGDLVRERIWPSERSRDLDRTSSVPEPDPQDQRPGSTCLEADTIQRDASSRSSQTAAGASS
jgi:hypothetical protein